MSVLTLIPPDEVRLGLRHDHTLVDVHGLPHPRVGSPATGRELRARGQRTVRKLLDAGIEVFGSKGYFPARVDDIVRGDDVAFAATGVTDGEFLHGVIYHHFWAETESMVFRSKSGTVRHLNTKHHYALKSVEGAHRKVR